MKQNKRRGLVLLLFVPLALFLNACSFNATLSVQEGGALLINSTASDQSGALSSVVGVNCNEAKFSDFVIFSGMASENKSQDNQFQCRFSNRVENAVDGKLLKEDKTSYTLHLSPDQLASAIPGLSAGVSAFEKMNGTFHLVIKMPGDITEASNGGTISGNTVTYSDVSALTSGDGIKVVGKKTKSSSTTSTVVIGVVLLILVVGGFILWRILANKKLDENENVTKTSEEEHILPVKYRDVVTNENGELFDTYAIYSALAEYEGDDEFEAASLSLENPFSDEELQEMVSHDDNAINNNESADEVPVFNDKTEDKEEQMVDEDLSSLLSGEELDEPVVNADNGQAYEDFVEDSFADEENNIDFVQPQMEVGDSYVPRLDPLPEIPHEHTQTSPIPGMPPRMDETEDESVRAVGVAASLVSSEQDDDLSVWDPRKPEEGDGIPSVDDVPSLPDINGPLDETTGALMPPRIPLDDE